MAKNVFRITPRASQVIRAIEGQIQAEHDDLCREVDALLQRVVFNAGDFVFGESSRWGRVEVRVSDLEIAYTLRDDPEFALDQQHFEGVVILRQQRVKKTGEKDFVYYITESIHLTKIEEAEEAA